MANKKNYLGEEILTPKGRVSFAHVFVPFDYDEPKNPDSPDAKYSMNLLIPKETDITGLKKAVMALAKKIEPDKSKRKHWNKAIVDGDEPNSKGKTRPEAEGCWIVKPWSKTKPFVMQADGKTTITEDSAFYSGCYARCKITPFYYDNKTEGISFFLGNIQKLADGENLSGRTLAQAQDDFEAVESDETAELDDDEDDDLF